MAWPIKAYHSCLWTGVGKLRKSRRLNNCRKHCSIGFPVLFSHFLFQFVKENLKFSKREKWLELILGWSLEFVCWFEVTAALVFEWSSLVIWLNLGHCLLLSSSVVLVYCCYNLLIIIIFPFYNFQVHHSNPTWNWTLIGLYEALETQVDIRLNVSKFWCSCC